MIPSCITDRIAETTAGECKSENADCLGNLIFMGSDCPVLFKRCYYEKVE